MNTLNHIGLNEDKSIKLAEQLNDLLANYSVFYQNTRGFHWKVQGKNFFELHVKFEELYNDLFMKIDEIAERILTLGQVPIHQFTSYLETSEIKEATEVTDGVKNIEQILAAFKIILIKQRSILATAGEIEDEGTNALMSDYISQQEKLMWMYNAYLKK